MKQILPLLGALMLLTANFALAQDPKDMKEILAPPTVISPNPFYVAIEGGAAYSEGYQKNGTELTNTVTKDRCGQKTNHFSDRNTVVDESGWGGVAGVKGGYSFSEIDLGSLTQWSLQPSAELEALYLGNSDYDAGALFLNGTLSLKNPSRLTPYVGAGVGGEYVSSGLANDHGFGFAVQAIGGVNYEINRHWSVFTEYHFIDNLSHDLDQHVALAGVKYNF